LSSSKAIRNCSIIACEVASSVGKFLTNNQWSMQLSSSTGVMTSMRWSRLTTR
jgi:hypothetical protein